MKQFCLDLSGLVGRVIGPADRELGDNDLLTSEIYSAAVEADIDIDAVMSADASELAEVLEGKTPWLGNCIRVLAKMRRRVPESTYHRILEVWTGTSEDADDDPDAKLCIEYAEGFFDTCDGDVDVLVDLATCLLDYAFTRQGLDDELARLTKKEPAELQKALVEAGGGKEDPAPRKEQTLEAHLEDIRTELFVVAVKEKLAAWRPSLLHHIIKLTPDTVYRVAMAASGHAVGDALVTQTLVGVQRHAANHNHPLVMIGHAALALEVLLVRRGIKPTGHGIHLEKRFCRNCGDELRRGLHGCCLLERNVQANQMKTFEQESRADAVHELVTAMKYQPRYRRHGAASFQSSYEMRITPLFDGTEKYEIHLDFWEEGIWQEVPSKEAADLMAIRALQEHERAQALMQSQGAAWPQTATAPAGNYSITQLPICEVEGCNELATINRSTRCSEHPRARELPQQSTALARMAEQPNDLDRVQLESQMNFGKSVRVLATVLGGLAFAFTQSYVILAFIGVAWVMAYAFMDHKAIEGAKKKALTNGETL